MVQVSMWTDPASSGIGGRRRRADERMKQPMRQLMRHPDCGWNQSRSRVADERLAEQCVVSAEEGARRADACVRRLAGALADFY